MAIKLGKLLISVLFVVFVLISTGCTPTPQSIECPECNCPSCPTKQEVCQECSYKEMGCVDVDEVNNLINLSNELLIFYNEASGNEPINPLPYYETIGGGP